jgi:hypothetical protein
MLLAQPYCCQALSFGHDDNPTEGQFNTANMSTNNSALLTNWRAKRPHVTWVPVINWVASEGGVVWPTAYGCTPTHSTKRDSEQRFRNWSKLSHLETYWWPGARGHACKPAAVQLSAALAASWQLLKLEYSNCTPLFAAIAEPLCNWVIPLRTGV